MTALMEAAAAGHIEVLRVLINAGANANDINRDGKSAIGLAAECQNWDCANRLLLNGAEFEYVETEDNDGRTELMNAVRENDLDAVTFLLDVDANLDVQEMHGKTAVMFAVEEMRPNELRALAEAGANLKLKNNDGRTALSLAKKLGYKAEEKILRGYGAGWWPW